MPRKARITVAGAVYATYSGETKGVTFILVTIQLFLFVSTGKKFPKMPEKYLP